MQRKVLIFTVCLCLLWVLEGCTQVCSPKRAATDDTLYGLTLRVFCDEIKAVREKEKAWRLNPLEKVWGKEKYKMVTESENRILFPDAEDREPLIPTMRLTGYTSLSVTKVLGSDVRGFENAFKPTYQDDCLIFCSHMYSRREILIHLFLVCAENCDVNNDYNIRISSGETPLMLAAVLGDVRIVKYLVDHGARPDDVTNEFYYSDFPHRKRLTHRGGETALQYAVKSGHKDVYEYLLSLDSSQTNKR